MITEEMYEINIPIYIEKDWITYEYNSFARGYDAYINIWNLLVAQTLKCRQEPSNEVDKNAVAILRSDSWEKETIVGQRLFVPYSLISRQSGTILMAVGMLK